MIGNLSLAEYFTEQLLYSNLFCEEEALTFAASCRPGDELLHFSFFFFFFAFWAQKPTELV